jgi:hypothetical protein
LFEQAVGPKQSVGLFVGFQRLAVDGDKGAVSA